MWKQYTTNRGPTLPVLALTFVIFSFLSIARIGYDNNNNNNNNYHPRQEQRQQQLLTSPTETSDQGSNNWCRTQEEYNNGRWVRNNSTKLKYPYLSDPDPVWGPYCTKLQEEYTASGNDSNMIPDFLRYKWVPDSCDLDNEWDRQAFCQRMDGKTIGVSGDSMSQQFAHSLMGLSRGTVDNHLPFIIPTAWEGKPDHWVKLRIPLCPEDDQNNVTLVYQRWDKYEGQEQDRAALIALIEESDYLVLNWGVHYQTWTDMETTTDGFIGVLEQHWQPKKPERLFWRSTNVAHANCSNAAGPLLGINRNTNTSSTIDTINKFASVMHEEYNTHEIMLQDEHIVKPCLMNRLPGTTLLRVEDTTLQRPDGHREIGFEGQEDCLHYCEPGPVDHWAELFYHHVIALEI